MEVLGIRIDNLSRTEILSRVNDFLVDNKFHQIATVNPEFVLCAQKDEEFKNILNNCDLNIADGIGIWFAFLRFGKLLKSKIAGADLLDEILKIAEKNNLSVFLACDSRGLSSWEETREAILQKYPNLEVGGVNLSCHSERVKRVEESNEIKKISAYDIVFCNFGAPKQEKFIHSLKLLENSKIKLAMGLGGSFDYLTGEIKRVPKWMRQIGLEWLFRLILEPRYRYKRIFNAVVIFPIKVLFYE